MADDFVAAGGVEHLQHVFGRHLCGRFFADAAADFVFPLLFVFRAHQRRGELPFLPGVELAVALLVNLCADELSGNGVLVEAAAAGAAADEDGGEDSQGFWHDVFRWVVS